MGFGGGGRDGGCPDVLAMRSVVATATVVVFDLSMGQRGKDTEVEGGDVVLRLNCFLLAPVRKASSIETLS